MRKQQFTGKPFEGIIHQKEQRVDMTATRGIIWTRPERFVVNTPFGQLDIANGDWVVEMPSGARYVVKAGDIEALGKREVTLWQKVRAWLAAH